MWYNKCKGNVAKLLRLALGACIIQVEYGYSDEEVAMQIQETAYLQFFCGYAEYNDEKSPFDPSLMVYFRKRLTPEILGEINEMIISKAKAPVEFGAKLDISVVNGFTRLEYHNFNACNEALKLPEMIERYKDRTESYPERILADKIYRNRDNLSYCAERKIRLSGPALGRPKKDEIRNKEQDYTDEAERVEVECKFSLAKRKCGIGHIVTRLKETTCHCLAMSVMLLKIYGFSKYAIIQ